MYSSFTESIMKDTRNNRSLIMKRMRMCKYVREKKKKTMIKAMIMEMLLENVAV